MKFERPPATMKTRLLHPTTRKRTRRTIRHPHDPRGPVPGDWRDMSAKLTMVTRKQFGFSNRAHLNRALVDALKASMQGCETCREIEKEIELNPEGGEYVEAPSFPGKTVQKLDAHFKSHWREEY